MVTVIVPVFNLKKTLKKCVDSVLSQTYSDLEIILVDDGSTDSSEKLCDTYPVADSRVSVLHVENGGVASARNHGIKIAKGEYITFIDSDDHIEPDYLEKLVAAMDGDDCILSMCNSYEFKNGDLKKRIFSTKEKCSVKEYFEVAYYYRAEGGTCWGKLFRTADIKNMFRDFNYCEDVFFIFDYLAGRDGYISIVPDCLYYYVRREDSITGMNRTSDLADMLGVCNGIREICCDKYPDIIDAANSLLVNNAFFVYLKSQSDKSAEGKSLREKAIKDVRKYRGKVLHDKKSTMKTKMACLISYISLRMLRHIYYFI